VLAKSRFFRYAPSLSAITEILTIGHSTHEPEAFRGCPGSAGKSSGRRSAGLDRLVHLPELGGRRDPHDGSLNGGWRVGQFRGYADHMAGEEFASGLERLLALAAERRTAVMCAEAQWRRCHRRLLSDALLIHGWEVLHVGARGDLEPHRLTDFALVQGTRVTYPPSQAAMDV
jgi:uncharacterized protein (DUF488 family)